MGFFDFLKEKPEEKHPVGVEDLANWIAHNSKGKSERIKEQLGDIYSEIDDAILKAKADLRELKEYEIRKVSNEQITGIVNQSRKVYAGFVEEFLEQILGKRDDAEAYLANYIHKSVNFSKQSLKSFHISSELIGKPLENILDDLKKIDLCFRKISELLKNEISGLNSLNKSVSNLANLTKLKKENKESIAEKLAKIKDINEKISSLRSDDENLRKSPKYAEKERLKKEINDVSDKIKRKKEEIVLAFSIIRKGIKKFEWLEHNKHSKKILNGLIEDTFDTLSNSNQVIHLLNQLSEKIKNNEITDINLNQIENAKNSLKIPDEINHLNSMLDELHKKDESMRLEWNEFKIKESEDEIKRNKRLNEGSETKTKELESSIEILKREIEKKAEEYLGKRLEIILA